MNHQKITISTEYIKLDQLIKLAGVTTSGSDAKTLIAEGKVKVNGMIETQRGKKLREGDHVELLDFFLEVDRRE